MSALAILVSPRGGACRALASTAGAVLAAVLVSAAAPADAGARGRTSKADEKQVTRVVRITPREASYHETHHCTLQAFNQTNDKIVLWGEKGPQWAPVDAVTAWKTPAEFRAAVKPIPIWGRVHAPLWSELPGEADILYSMNVDTGEVMRIDVVSGTHAVVLALPGKPQFARNFFLPGFTSDGKLVVWEEPDDIESRGWEVDLRARTARMVAGQPAQWSPEWTRFPFNTHGHSARSPDRTSVIAHVASDMKGYGSYLMRKGERTLGLQTQPEMSHVAWQASNAWAVFDDVPTGSLHQLWTDGTAVKLLDLRLSKVPLSEGGFYRISSFPNVSRDGRMILYSSDGGDRNGNIGIFLAFLGDANAGSPVAIERFGARPSVVLASGGSSELRWSTKNATGVRISPGPGAVAVSGSVRVTPASDTEYELTAEGPGGPVTARQWVRLRSPSDESLIPNGSMELGVPSTAPSGWRGGTADTVTHEDAYDFANALRVSSAWKTRSQGKVSISVPSEQVDRARGQRVKLSAWLKSATTRAVRGESLQVLYGEPRQALISPIEEPIGPEWKKFETAFVLPDDLGGRLSVAIVTTGGWEDATVLVDRVALELESRPAAPVIDAFEISAAGADATAPVSLRWKTSGASSLVLMPMNLSLGPPGEGTWVFGGDFALPGSGTTLELVAQGPGGTASASARYGAPSGESPKLPPPGAPGLEGQ